MLPTIGGLVGGKYRVVRLIGEGGMGAVYEARHEQLGMRVALKFLHPDLAERQALGARFLQEARVSARIKSPHVTHVMDVDQTPEGDAYFVMELLEGESLEQRIQRAGLVPLDEALDIAMQILAALEAAHAEGVIHRDLKPDNVWLTPSPGGPFVKLLDFGIAKLKTTGEFQSVHTRPGSMMGTPQYMAPEQAVSADQVDARADLYSFGVMTYEMITGQRPVPGDDVSEILQALVRGEARPLLSLSPEVPPELASLVDALVAANPDDRPSDATAVRSVFARYVRSSNPALGPMSRRSLPVPMTVPPDEPGLPPYVTRSQQVVVPGSTGTSAMEIRDPAFGIATTARADEPSLRPPRRHMSAWIVFGALAAVGAGAAAWAVVNASSFGGGTAPPLPLPSPAASAPTVTILKPPPAGRAPDGRSEKRRGTPSRGESAETAPEGRPLPFPTFPQMPIPFPIPSGIIPSALPPLYPLAPQGSSPSEVPPVPSSSAGP
jgi:serine/threonine-protein kinase